MEKIYYIVRDQDTMRYVIKTTDLVAALRKFDECVGDGMAVWMVQKTGRVNQLQAVDPARIAQARSRMTA